MTVRELAEQFTIFEGTVKTILTDILGLQRVAAKLIPKSLNFLQKQFSVDVAKEMGEHVNNDTTFIQRIITHNETWISS